MSCSGLGQTDCVQDSGLGVRGTWSALLNPVENGSFAKATKHKSLETILVQLWCEGLVWPEAVTSWMFVKVRWIEQILLLSPFHSIFLSSQRPWCIQNKQAIQGKTTKLT